jgi:heme-degrading monooxygenase HmoA
VFARIARYDVDEERMDAAAEAFREAASQLASLAGFQGGYVLTAREDGLIMTLTLWESRSAMETSEVRAARLRHEATRQVDGSVTSVQCFEVAVDIGGPPERLDRAQAFE